MVSREEALRLLESARDYEEKLIRDLDYLMDQVISRMRLSPEQDAVMRGMWRRLVDDSKRHERQFQELVEYVRNGEESVY